jgi:hypothetical protein
MKAKATMTIIAVASVLTSGCVVVTSKSFEKLSREERRLPSPPAPRIAVRFEGPDKRVVHLAKVYEKVKGKHEFLANAKGVDSETRTPVIDGVPAQYRFRVSESQKQWGSPELTGVSLLLFPYYEANTVEYLAVLTDDAGYVVSQHRAELKLRWVTQMWLYYVTPVSLVALKDIHAHRKAVRALLDLVERDIRRDLAARQSLPAPWTRQGTGSGAKRRCVSPSSGTRQIRFLASRDPKHEIPTRRIAGE